MTLAYFDCFSGIAGDMVLAAMLDAGLPIEALEAPLAKMPIANFHLEVSRVGRLGIAATYVRVHGSIEIFPNYLGMRRLIEDASVTDAARTLALDIWERLAVAEATVHGVDVEHVRFHELGSADTIVDVIGAAIGLTHLGITRVEASPVATGMGMARTEHGMIPIPGPAVTELLKGAPLYSQGVPYELVTPTGAAILAATVQRWGDLPAMRVAQIGYGAGTRELEIPNVVRLLIGAPSSSDDLLGPVPAVLLEANIDDMNPEFYEYVLERLFDAGAQDAWLTPVTMKRGRPATTVSVLCGPDTEAALRDVLFRETTTIGMRRRATEKWVAPREFIQVEIDGHPIKVKVARDATTVLGIAPEYQDCVAAARATGRALKDIYAAAQAAARLA